MSETGTTTRVLPTPWPRARRLAAELPDVLPSVHLPLGAALGAVIAHDLHARTALPADDTAAMDGFAVAGACPWSVVGQVLAGHPAPTRGLADGECVEVATGATLPDGATAVLPYENAIRQGSSVSGCADPGQHIRPRAEDCADGARLVPAGGVATPAVLGLAASAGHDRVPVVRRPEVTVLTTGDELLDHGRPGGGRVRDAIGPMMPGLVAGAGGVTVDSHRLGDDRRTLHTALATSTGDVVVVSGGSAAGPADHLRSVLAQLDADVMVGSVACRPGHPQLLARLPDGRWVLGLPGNPFAALVAAMTLMTPLLTRLAGRTPPPPVFGRLTRTVAAHPGDTRLVSATVRDGTVEPVGLDRAGSLRGAALADALAVIPPGSPSRRVELLSLPL